MHDDPRGLQRTEDLLEILRVDQRHGDENGPLILLDEPHSQMRNLPPPQPQILEVAGRDSHDLAQHITDHLRVIDQRCGPPRTKFIDQRALPAAERAVHPDDHTHLPIADVSPIWHDRPQHRTPNREDGAESHLQIMPE